MRQCALTPVGAACTQPALVTPLPFRISQPFHARRLSALRCSLRPVQVLPLQVVQRIASAAVIDGYVAVVRELVENSLDAGARGVRVDVDLVARGVVVSDDGGGVSVAQGLRRVGECNATSKLGSVEELKEGVSTLGFRGQGLWALAAVADGLAVASRVRGVEGGVEVLFGGDGELLEERVVAMACGTVVRVTDLPWQYEGRSAAGVLRACKEWLVRTALCHPHVSFSLSRADAIVWRYVRLDGDWRYAVRALLAAQLKRHVRDFGTAERVTKGLGAVRVAVGLPSVVHAASTKWIIVTVNGRCVDHERVCHAVRDAAGIHVPRSRHPVVFAELEVRAACVDWNISPMKHRIRFTSKRDEDLLVDNVISAVHEAVQFSRVEDGDTNPDMSLHARNGAEQIAPGGRTLRSLFASFSEQEIASDDYRNDRDGSSTLDSHGNVLSGFANLKVICQVLETYILVERDGGIMLIEQHVAHERVLFEQLSSEWSTSFRPLSDPLLIPGSIGDERAFALTSLGFDVTSGLTSAEFDVPFHVWSLPQTLLSSPKEAIVSILLELSLGTDTCKSAAASVACRLAVRNGSTLSMSRMEYIVSALSTTQNPRTCPHGRPILFELGRKDLASIFGRSWTPQAKPKKKAGSPVPQSGRLEE